MRTLYAVLGAFMLAVAGLGAVACDGVTDPPTNKPPEVDGVDVPPVRNQKGVRIGNDIALEWRDPLATSGKFDSIEITFTPLKEGVDQPITASKGDEAVTISGLNLAVSYLFTIKTVRGSDRSDGKTVTVSGKAVAPAEAIPAALEAATGTGATVDDPCKVVLEHVDLSTQINMSKLFEALQADDRLHFSLDLTESVCYTWESYAMAGVGKVVKLVMPEVVNTIVAGTSTLSTFNKWTNLREVSGAGVTTIGAYAFASHATLTKATFGDDISDIGERAFAGCTALATITAPGTKKIGQYAFQNAKALTSADFPLATEMGGYAFNACSALVTADFPLLTTIGGQDAFAACSALESVSMPKLKVLPRGAFYWDYNLRSVTFEELEEIGLSALTFCQSLPGDDDTEAFAALCASFSTVKKLGSSMFASTGNGPQTGTDPDLGTPIYATAPPFKSLAMFPNLELISNDTFYGLTQLEVASLPNLTTAGSGTFGACPALKEVDFPLLTSWTPSFYNATTPFPNIEVIRLPALTGEVAGGWVQNEKFRNLPALTTVDLSSVTRLGSNTTATSNIFEGCPLLEKVILPATPPVLNASTNNNLFGGTTISTRSDENKIILEVPADYDVEAYTTWLGTILAAQRSYLEIVPLESDGGDDSSEPEAE